MAHTEFCLRTDAVLTDDAAHELRKLLRDAFVIMRPFSETITCTFEIVPTTRHVSIAQCDMPCDPLDSDNFFVMYCTRQRYNLGHKDAANPFEKDYVTGEQVLRNDVLAILPLYLYDHSGITISTGTFNDRWDSGHVGWIYCTAESLDVTGALGTPEQLETWMKAFIDNEYDQYIRGNVWSYVITDENDDVIDSCSGFIGDELEKNGLLDHIPKELHEATTRAWGSRF